MQGGSVCVGFTAFVCVCVYLRVVVRDCQRPMGGSQRARAAPATQAESLLTWSSSKSARGGRRPRLHSLKQQALCWNIDVMVAHSVLPASHMYWTCVIHIVDLFFWPSCNHNGATDVWILKADASFGGHVLKHFVENHSMKYNLPVSAVKINAHSLLAASQICFFLVLYIN